MPVAADEGQDGALAGGSGLGGVGAEFPFLGVGQAIAIGVGDRRCPERAEILEFPSVGQTVGVGVQGGGERKLLARAEGPDGGGAVGVGHADLDSAAHGDGFRALDGPRHAVGGVGRGEGVAAAVEFEPDGRGLGDGGGTEGRGAAGGLAALEDEAVAGGEGEQDVFGVRIEALAHHQTEAGPAVGGGDGGDADRERAVAEEGLGNVFELVGGRPDVGAEVGEDIAAVVERHALVGGGADGAFGPRPRQGVFGMLGGESDLVEDGGRQGAGDVAANREADVGRRPHGQGHPLRERPVGAVGGVEGLDHLAMPGDLHPAGRGACDGGVGHGAVGDGAILEREPAARSDEHGGVFRAGREGLADHDAGLGPDMGVGHRGEAGDEDAAIRERLINVMEGVGPVPDVRAGAAHGEGAGLGGHGDGAGNAHPADIGRAPAGRQGLGASTANQAEQAAENEHAPKQERPGGTRENERGIFIHNLLLLIYLKLIKNHGGSVSRRGYPL